MKTVFISSFHPLISRNIIGTSIIARLRERGVRIVVLVPEKKVGYFRKTYDELTIEGVSVPQARWENALTALSMGLVGVENHIVEEWKRGHRFKYYLTILVHTLFSRARTAHSFVRTLMRTFLHTSAFDELFKTYKPDLVVATDIFGRADRALILEASRKGIATMGMVRSWDNPTTKGLLVARPNHLMAPNEVVKEELVSIHRYPAEKITVVGIPHYDTARDTGGISREQFFAAIGLDPKKKTILFAPGGKILYKHDGDILTLSKKLIDGGRFEIPVQCLVRIPPGDRVDTSSIEGDRNFVVDDPGVNVTGRKKESELSPGDNRHLNCSILYSDIMLTLASTMAIDGMVVGKPVVIWGFDPRNNLPDSVQKFARYAHIQKLFATGLVTPTRSVDEFVDEINAYLKDPSRDSKKREDLVARYAYEIGHASDRVANCLLRALG